MTAPWLPCPLTVCSNQGARSPRNLEDVVRALRVDTDPRYAPRDLNADGTRETFCNIFLWDFSRAMGVEIPHWVDAQGCPCAPGKGLELNANATVRWMVSYGVPHYGWEQVLEPVARARVLRGEPTVALWQNHSGIGHVAALVPARTGETYIAQAGAACFSRGPLSRGFGRLSPVFYSHA